MTFTKLACLYFCFACWGGIATFGASSGKKLMPVVLQLDWIANVQFAGVYQAVEQGFYEEAGMKVEVRTIPAKGSSIDAVLNDPAPYILGVAESSSLQQKSDDREGIKVIATMFQDSPLGWMSMQSSEINTIADFKGKRVGVHIDGVKALGLVLSQVGLGLGDLEVVEVGWDPSVLIKGEVDLMQGYYIDEFVRLQLLSGGKGKIMMARDYGYLAYSQVIFTTEEMMEAQHELVKNFLQATKKGWQYALEHIEESADLVIGKYSPDLDRDYQVASMRRVAEMVSPGGQPPLHPMDPGKWAASQRNFLKVGIVTDPTDLEALLDFSANP